MTDIPAEMQAVLLDNDERRLIQKFRQSRQNEYSDGLWKIHRGKLTALYVTEKWNANAGGRLREVKEGEE